MNFKRFASTSATGCKILVNLDRVDSIHPHLHDDNKTWVQFAGAMVLIEENFEAVAAALVETKSFNEGEV